MGRLAGIPVASMGAGCVEFVTEREMVVIHQVMREVLTASVQLEICNLFLFV